MSSDASRKRQSQVPLAGLWRMHEEYLPAAIFSPDDVGALNETAGIVPVKDLDPSYVARLLQWAVTRFIAVPSITSAPGVTRKRAGQLRDAALNSLSLLDADPETGQFRRLDAAAILLHASEDDVTYSIRQAMGPYLFVATLPGEKTTAEEFASQSDEYWAAFDKGEIVVRRSRPEDFPIPDHLTTLNLTILGLAHLAKMADSIAKVSGEPRKGKKQPNLAEVNLVGELCRIYRSYLARRRR